MAKGFNIRAWLGLDTKRFSKGINSARGKMTAFQKGLKGTNDILRGLKFAAVGVTAVGAFSRAIGTMKDFQTNMARVQVLSGATTDQMQEMSAAARDIGANTRFSANEAASGLQFLSMAGLNANESLKVLPATMDLAGAGMLSVGRSADVMTNIMQAMSLSATDAVRVADLFAQAQAKSNQSVDELYEGAILAAPAYNALGLSVEELTRDMALMANAGVKAEKAGTGLAGALSRLLRQDGMTGKALKELGVNIDEASIKQDGLIGTIKRLRDAGITAEQRARIFGLHWKTVGTLVNYTDSEIAELTETVLDNGDAAKTMSDKGIGGIDKALKLLMSSLDELAISFGEDGFNGLLESAIGKVTQFVRWFTKLSGSMKVLNIAMVAAVFNLGALNTIALKGLRIFKVLPRLIGAGTLSFRGLGVAIKGALGPVGLLLLGIEGVSLALDAMYVDSTKSGENAANAVKNLNKELARGKKELSELSDTELVGEAKSNAERRRDLAEDIKNEEKQRLKHTDQQLQKKRDEFTTLKNQFEILKQIASERDKKRGNDKETKEVEATLKNLEAQKEAYDLDQKALANLKKKNKDFESLISKNKIFKITTDDLAVSATSMSDAFVIEGKTTFFNPQTAAIIKDINAELGKTAESIIGLSTMEMPEGGIDGYISKLSESFTLGESLAGNFRIAMKELGEEIGMFAQEGSDSWAQFGSDMGNIARDIIKQLIAVGVTSAVQSALSSVTLPFPLNVLAAPVAAAAATTAFNTLIPAFETGGIVGGTSYTGDKVPAMVNSGEMILNAGQQANLFKMANNSQGQGGEVEFKVKGDQLVGLLKNHQSKNKSFR